MSDENTPNSTFSGFRGFQANVTFVPLQFFTVVLPHSSRGTARIVGYALRKVLGWVDERGNPTCEQLRFTYRELIQKAGVGRDSIQTALKEAVDRHFLRCVRSARPDSQGIGAQSAVYELCWDETGSYTDVPAQFRGFFYPEAAVLDVVEGKKTVRRAKAARKNIPNAFFDVLLPRERLSVIRVVAALLYYSIQWGPGGERKMPVSRSISELARLARISRQHVHEAVLDAQRGGYIQQVDGGRFDPAAGRESRCATYQIRWAPSPTAGRLLTTAFGGTGTPPVGKGERESTDVGSSVPVEKGVRKQSEKVNGDRSEKGYGISIKKNIKTLKTTTEAVADDAGLTLLLEAGFDRETARKLARKHAPEVIERQVAWLPHRTATRSKLGFLRRAIEQDWPKPEGADSVGNTRLGTLFAVHYYAAYHGNTGAPVTEPFPKDVRLASSFVERLQQLEPAPEKVPEWGRRFGLTMRERHRFDTKAKPHLCFALVLYSDAFFQSVVATRRRQSQNAAQKGEEAHRASLLPAYIDHLRQLETRLQTANPTLYGAFTKQRARIRHAMTGGLFLASAETLASFDSDTSRLQAFAEFFRGHAEFPVPDFTQWEASRSEPLPALGKHPIRLSTLFVSSNSDDQPPSPSEV